METTIVQPITFSEGAKQEIIRLMNEPDFETTQLLRVGVKGGGCSGMTYVLGFDQPTDQDERFEADGFTYVMNKSHGIYLFGMQVDWSDGLNSRGFVFKNPNASSTCGCGTSFSV